MSTTSLCIRVCMWATTWKRISTPRGNRAKQNITLFDEPVQKIVCVMQGDEFFSTWVANKSVYRTRMALADGGELVVIAPGLKRFRRAAGGGCILFGSMDMLARRG